MKTMYLHFVFCPAAVRPGFCISQFTRAARKRIQHSYPVCHLTVRDPPSTPLPFRLFHLVNTNLFTLYTSLYIPPTPLSLAHQLPRHCRDAESQWSRSYSGSQSTRDRLAHPVCFVKTFGLLALHFKSLSRTFCVDIYFARRSNSYSNCLRLVS